MQNKLVITGGHHSSALPVIKKLQKENPDIQIYWFGHKYSMRDDKNTTLEYKEITALNIPFYDLKAGKLYKTYNLWRLLKIPFGILHAFILLLMLKPKLILSFGGYLAAPTVISGWFLKIPSITHEQTVVAGYANKLISKFAKKIMISWPTSAKHFTKEKTILTGIPIRPEIYIAKTNNFNINAALPTVYITAGKTGSHAINLAVERCLEKLLSTCNVIHQCGDNSVYNDFDRLSELYQKVVSQKNPSLEHMQALHGNYFLRKFVLEDEIGEAFSKAALVVSRAGAHITAEIIALEKPAVLIPIPWVSHNEQMENATLIKDAGLGVILEERHLSGDSLFSIINHALQHIQALNLRDKGIKTLIKPNSIDLVVGEVLEYF